jgi:hypothetical protein
MAMRLRNFAVAAVVGLTTAGVACTGRVATTAPPRAAAPGVTVGPVTDVSLSACAPDNAEVIDAAARDLATTTWWIDGAIAADAAGILYATWDTQASERDTGWLSYSSNGGRTWSPPVRVTPDDTTAPHIVQSAGGSPGIGYVGWLSDSSPHGYALYLRVFAVGRGWLTGPVQVSRQFGKRAVWPGDTFGIATLVGAVPPALVLTWASAVSGGSHIYAARVSS